MLSSNNNPYLRPEYLNPPPTNNTMDSKKSPLALLAQTCSQIGADPATLKNGPPSSGERKKTTSESQNSKSSPVLSVDNNNRVPSTTTTTNSSDATPLSSAKNKKSSTASSENNNRLTPTTGRRSKSTSPKNPNRSSGSSSIQTLLSSTDQQPSTAGTTTSVSTGLMSHLPLPQQQHPASIHPSSHHHHLMMAAALAGQGSSDSSSLANSYKSLMAVAGMGPYGAPYPPPYSSSSSPSYGPPHPSAMDFGAYASALNAAKSSSSAGQQQQHSFIPTSSAATAAALMTGYLANHPAAAYSAALQQAMQYGNAAAAAARANSKSNENGPPCRDPYCTGCPSNNNVGVATQMVCTAGCGLGVQCDHLKIPIPAQHLQMISGPSTSPSSPHRPYVCNWIVGDNYCGKRFGSSDDLLQHLRTHTNLSADGGGGGGGPAAAFTGHHPSSMMRAAYPTPPLSPLSAARYHPYGKANPATSQPFHHPGMAAAMAAMAGPYGPPPPPPSLFQHLNPALAPYYSHLSFFNAQANQPSSQRPSTLGPAPPGPP